LPPLPALMDWASRAASGCGETERKKKRMKRRKKNKRDENEKMRYATKPNARTPGSITGKQPNPNPWFGQAFYSLLCFRHAHTHAQAGRAKNKMKPDAQGG